MAVVKAQGETKKYYSTNTQGWNVRHKLLIRSTLIRCLRISSSSTKKSGFFFFSSKRFSSLPLRGRGREVGEGVALFLKHGMEEGGESWVVLNDFSVSTFFSFLLLLLTSVSLSKVFFCNPPPLA